MLRKLKTICLVLFAAAMLVSCSGSTFSTTTAGNKITIKVDAATDGAEGETLETYVGKNRVGKITSSLEKGQLQLDFAQATVFTYEDEPDDVVVGDVIDSVTVGPDETAEIILPEDYYVIKFKAIGDTSGSVEVVFEKQ